MTRLPFHPKARLRPASVLCTLLLAPWAMAQPDSILHPDTTPERGTVYRFKHLQTGARQLRGGVFPGDTTLRPSRPSSITKAPDGLALARFGTVRVPALLLGTNDDLLRGTAFEMPQAKDPTHQPIRFWIDLDGDGDLTNNSPTPDAEAHDYARTNRPLAAQMERLSTGIFLIGENPRTYLAGTVKGTDQFLVFVGPAWPEGLRPTDFDWTKAIGMLLEVPPLVENPPAGLVNPRFGVLRFGDRASPRRYLTILDLPKQGSEGVPRLFVDSNADGRFDEPAIEMARAEIKPTAKEDTAKPSVPDRWTCTARVMLEHAGAKGSAPSQSVADLLMEVRLDPAESMPESLTLTYRGEWGRVGLIRIGAAEHKSLLFDELASGDYRGSLGGNDSGVRLLIDLNDNEKFERGEAFDPARPFEIDGARYHVEDLGASGESFRLVREEPAKK